MAEVTQNVIIDFSVDYTELTNAQEQLAKSGKVDATQFTALNKSLKTTALDTKGLIQEFKNVGATATKMGKSVEAAFGAGVQDALDEAGVSVDEFKEALVKANEPTKRLKTQLLELKEALAQAKLNGKDVGAEFEALREKAGKVEDAIRDAGAEIKNAGSDTRGIDNVVGSISALAGGFAAVQGAAALFGDENEDLQKALLKVNAALALSSGLQQFANATTKEGALTKLADTIATGGQTAAIKLYTFVTGGATVATKLLRAALIATGIGAIVFLLFEAARAMGLFGGETADTKKEIDALAESFADAEKELGSFLEQLNFNNDLAILNLKKRGATEKEIHEQQLENIKAEQRANFKLFEEGQKQIDARKKKHIEENNLIREKAALAGLDVEGDISKRNLQFAKDTKEIQESVNASKEAARKKYHEGIILDATFQAKVAEDQRNADAENAKKRKEAQDKASAAARAARLAELNDALAVLQQELLFVKKNSLEELDLKKRIIIAKRNIELEAEKLTANQVRLIRATAYKDQLDLQEEFNKRATTEELQSQIDTTTALLAGIGLTNEKRLQLQIENITTTSQLEINAAEGNSAKILLIEAKRIADIRALKLAAIDAERSEQISSTQKTNDIVKTALEKVAADRKNSIDVRIAAIKGIESQEKLSNQNQIDDLRRKYDEGLISLSDYQAKAAILNQTAADIEQKSIDDQDKAREDSKEKRIEDLKEIAEVTIEVAGQVADFFSNLSSLATAQDQQRIDLQKRQLVSLVEAGAITEKEAKIRAQQIEILERQAKNRQAVREKQIAVFNALLAIPQAYLAGLKSGPQGLVLGPIFALIAAAQAAIVIARPVPKFFRGKKGNYEGPGSIAEIGSEIVERGGRMVLYTKPTQTFLGAKDKVYTHAETRQIMHNTNINTTLPAVKQEKIDYEKFAKAIPKQSIAINIEKDFISEAVNEGLSKNNYFNNRYGFK